MDFVEQYLHYNRDHASPKIYQQWMALYMTGTALSRRAWIGDLHTNPLFPNFYIILVGPPGPLFKSTCISTARRIIDEANVIHILPSSARKECFALELKGLQVPQPENVTHWKDVLTGCEGAFYVRELSSLLGSAHRRDNDIIDWLIDWYDSRPPSEPWPYRTIKRFDNPENLHRFAVHLVAGTTPRYVEDKFPDGCVEEGFGGRVIWVYCTMDDLVESDTNWGWEGKELEATALVRRMETIGNDPAGHGQYKMDDDATALLNVLLKQWTADMKISSASPIVGFLSRKQNHILKAALCRAAGDEARWGDKLIIGSDITWAENIVDELVPRLENLFRAGNRDVAARVANEMKVHLERSWVEMMDTELGLKGPLQAAILPKFKEYFGGLYSQVIMLRALNIVEQYGWGFIHPQKIKLEGQRRRREVIVYSAEGGET